MSPLKFSQPATADDVYGHPFRGPLDHTHQMAVNIAALTTREVDAQGYLKPGVPLAVDGTTVGAGERVFGVVPEPVKVAASNSGTDLTAAGIVQIVVGIEGVVNRHVIEDNLGGALTADEIAGFALAGSQLVLLA